MVVCHVYWIDVILAPSYQGLSEYFFSRPKAIFLKSVFCVCFNQIIMEINIALSCIINNDNGDVGLLVLAAVFCSSLDNIEMPSRVH